MRGLNQTECMAAHVHVYKRVILVHVTCVSDVRVFLHQTFALYGSYIRNCHGYFGESVPVHCECQSWLLLNPATFAIASLHKLIYIIIYVSCHCPFSAPSYIHILSMYFKYL